MFRLKIIITSTRPGRKGLPVGEWVAELAGQHPQFQTEILDLATINLPFLDEPNHPRLRNYQHQHTKDWSKVIDDADAFIFVTPEYNYSFTAPFKNAIDYLLHEWKHKPAGIVSYGGVSGGTRAAQMVRLVLASVDMTPLFESVTIPFVAKLFDTNGKLVPNEQMITSANVMLTALARWSETLKPMRAPKTQTV